MTLLELDRSLPNGFHDVRLNSFSANYVKRVATLTLDVLIGVSEGESESAREAYRPALLKLSGLEYFIIDPPDSNYKYAEPKGLWIDAGQLVFEMTSSKSSLVIAENEGAEGDKLKYFMNQHLEFRVKI